MTPGLDMLSKRELQDFCEEVEECTEWLRSHPALADMRLRLTQKGLDPSLVLMVAWADDTVQRWVIVTPDRKVFEVVEEAGKVSWNDYTDDRRFEEYCPHVLAGHELIRRRTK